MAQKPISGPVHLPKVSDAVPGTKRPFRQPNGPQKTRGGQGDLNKVQARLDRRRRNTESLLSINSNDFRPANLRLLADVLVTVKEQARLHATNIASKGLEAEMDFVVSVVDASGRIVGDEHVNWRKCSHQTFDLILVVEKVPSWLISPRATEAAEHQTTVALCAKMQVEDRSWERASAVVIAFNGEDSRTLCRLCRLQNDVVSNVTAGDQDIGSLPCQALDERVFVGDDKEHHRWSNNITILRSGHGVVRG